MFGESLVRLIERMYDRHMEGDQVIELERLPTPPPGRQFVHPSGEPLQEKWIYFNTDRQVA